METPDLTTEWEWNREFRRWDLRVEMFVNGHRASCYVLQGPDARVLDQLNNLPTPDNKYIFSNPSDL